MGSRLKQVAALPYDIRDGVPHVLLVTSRGTGRAILPKGWPMRGKSNRKAAAIEAMEEAGVVGRTWKDPIGTFGYWKCLDGEFRRVTVEVYPIEVEDILDRYKERGQRRSRWLPVEDAALAIEEPSLSALIQAFGSHPDCVAAAPAPFRM